MKTRIALSGQPLALCRQGLLVGVLLLGASVDEAQAASLCASPLGHVRLRESCKRHEQVVDVSRLARNADPVPLTNWEVSESGNGLESAAAAVGSVAPDATFINLDPCRLIDTRVGQASAFDGDDIGPFSAAEIRNYELYGLCDIPGEATALSINLAVVPGALNGFVSVGPAGSISGTPSFASINFQGSGPAISNSLVVPLNEALGNISVYAANAVDVIIDTNGYFLPKDAGTRDLYVPGTGTDTENGALLAAVVGEMNSTGPSLSATVHDDEQPTGVVFGGASLESVQAIAPEDDGAWRIELGPGTFDLGTTPLVLGRQVAFIGAGRNVTTIVCDCSSHVLLAADGTGLSEIRDLRIENSNNGATARGLTLEESSGSVVRAVDIVVEGEDGIRLDRATDVRIEQVDVDAERSALTLVTDSDGTMVRDSTLLSDTGPTVSADDSDVQIFDSTVQNVSATIATLQPSTSGAITAHHSRLITGGGSYASGSSGSLTLRSRFINATTLTFSGTSSCTATAGPAASFATTCP